MSQDKFQATFWGVRGSHPVSKAEILEFGGNTSCIELEIADQLIILDAGTGIINLGERLEDKNDLMGHLFISHVHWDHIQGFPFFKPGFNPQNSFVIYGRPGIKDFLMQQMESPYFPVGLDEMQAKMEFEEVENKERIELPAGIKVEVFSHPHPDGAFSFRIEEDERSICYITDVEARLNIEEIIDFVAGADVIIYDSHFTDNEYLGENGEISKSGWGHSTWQEGVKIVQAAGGERLVLFHHAPWRDDKQLKEIEQAAQEVYSKTIMAQEGMVINL